MSIGLLYFGMPLALFGLLVLPALWWVLRALPAPFKRQILPSTALLENIQSTEVTPDRTPWWIIVFRALIMISAILGLSQPSFSPPEASDDSLNNPILIVVDDGWTSASQWEKFVRAGVSQLRRLPSDTSVYLHSTTSRSDGLNPSERLSPQEAIEKFNNLEPVAWLPDRTNSINRLTTANISPNKILWISDGLRHDIIGPFTDYLIELGDLTIYPVLQSGVVAISNLEVNAQGVRATLDRVSTSNSISSIVVNGLTANGVAVASQTVEFSSEDVETEVEFNIAPEILNSITKFTLAKTDSAGLVWLLDSNSVVRRVGLISTYAEKQPLLSELYYIRKALESSSVLTDGSVQDLTVDQPHDVIVLADAAQIQSNEIDTLKEWIEAGGTLIRFAGSRFANSTDPNDDLTPIPLRRTSRSLGGALSWATPQLIAEFPNTSPFFGFEKPENVLIKKQILAQPGPEVANRTWARLEDGSPLVTASQLGLGKLILFHVPATPEWSDLPYSNVFSDMLRQSVSLSFSQSLNSEIGSDTLVPQQILDGFGQLRPPEANISPLQTAELNKIGTSSQSHPPGFYSSGSRLYALNAGAGFSSTAIQNWPDNSKVISNIDTSIDLTHFFLTLAFVLILLDILLALTIAGKFRILRTAFPVLLTCLILFDVSGSAQAEEELPKEIQAALKFRLAYIGSDTSIDKITEAGLLGLSRVLYRRSSIEPEYPHRLNPEKDSLELYPLIYYAVPDRPWPFSKKAIDNLNRYIASGGALIIDTRSGRNPNDPVATSWQEVVKELNIPPLSLVPDTHVLTKSYYLLSTFVGRYGDSKLWIETSAAEGAASGDSVSGIFIGDGDWAGAWAIDQYNRPLKSVDGGELQREMSRRFGVNLVMYILTGRYKEDQVHIPAILERLGKSKELRNNQKERNE